MKLKYLIAVIVCVFLVIMSLSMYLTFSINLPPKTFTDDVKTFKIAHGTSVKKIITNLKEAGIIKSENYAYIIARLKKLNLKAGSYSLNSNMTTQDVLFELTKGSQVLKKITIPEGLTLKKTATLFDKINLIKEDEFLQLTKDSSFLNENGITANTAEGFLFPDTYFFGEEDTPKMMLSLIFKTFFEKTKTIKNFPSDFEEAYKKIILASIIEREYQLDEEAPLIAGVFLNRLKINMGLQSCATVEYIITEIKNKKHPTRLFYEDLEIDNPYNTYLYSGLPPTPIASPGITALSAACNPKSTDYFYFRLVDPNTGKHTFSRTVEEHNKVGNLLYLKNK